MLVPTLAGALVLAVLVDTLRSASSHSAGEWAAATLGILVGGFITYLSALRSRVVFDASREEVRWRLAGWPGQRQGACPLAQLRGLQVLGDRAPGGVQGLALLTPGDSIPLTRHGLAVGRDCEATATAVSEWLARHGYEVPAV